ncbi:hypothetical protein C2S52_022028 [Perilla frutescens var. hirtella]|nr:hypothetical protein C2S52_022028 [Perilla frutescens var. hirtella]KAH6807563.1 hypothetical protein C2S51_028671 [Perilla frutescens var. frutescens]
MGCSLSCMEVQVKVKVKAPPKFSSIRIVRLNGLVEEIEYPITVAEVTGKQPHNHFLFTQAQLLGGATTHLKVDAALEAGRVYFLLPSTLNVSPMELAPIARKLASIAQNTPSKSKSKSKSAADADSSSLQQQKYGGKSRSWKPILSTIRERSFNRRSESDLQAEEQDTNINQN